MTFILGESQSNSSERLSCLEGMRAISMTWVILGHNFLFGSMTLQVNNPATVDHITSGDASPAVQAILQGDYSVDTFFFIGATLVSYLLLRDLDKTKGWANKEGFVHLVLFYVNRYLRITIPYALAMAFFIGITPLVLKEPITAASWAYQEAELCKEWAWTHFLYINIFYEGSTYCMGQTWFLSTDMIWYFMSPFLIFPLWTSKFGLVQRILSRLWWFFLLCGSVGISFWYYSNESQWEQWIMEKSLPVFMFAPWGYRSQCYLIGIMVGYQLYRTRQSGY